jgi:transglutaminase-like putative cysteine protease
MSTDQLEPGENGTATHRLEPGNAGMTATRGWKATTTQRLRGSGYSQRTLLALLASVLGVFPLKGLLADNGWLLDAWLTMLVAVAPAALLRLIRPPGALDIWPGIVLLVPWLTARFVPKHAWWGFIPTTGTWHDIGKLMNALHKTTRDEVAPIHSTVAVRLVVCALLGLLAALIDLIAVVGRRGALAGVPLLVIYTVSGAVPRDAVAWPWFVLAAIGFLILLALDAGDDLRTWGRHIAQPAGARYRPAIAVSGPRIAVAALVAAVLLPVLVPAHPRNLIADAFHNGNHGGTNNGTTGISPYARLFGELQRPTAQNLFTVHVSPVPRTVQPFYQRLLVLDSYDNTNGWRLGDHGQGEDVSTTNFDVTPPVAPPADPFDFLAKVTIEKLHDTPPPVFAIPQSLHGASSDTTWSPQDGLLLTGDVHAGQVITEEVQQPVLTGAQLTAASPAVPTELVSDLALPDDLPSYVRDLVGRITKTATTPYAKARAISNFFNNPKNGFLYSLKTNPGDSGSALVDFLKNRQGFCQQYAGAMGVMLRVAGIPTRVVLGYEHNLPDQNGNFTVTTSDAHSWVEAYFTGVGWVPFDPTPISGLAGGPANDLGYAPHPAYAGGNDANSNAPKPTLTQGLSKNNTQAPNLSARAGAQGATSIAAAVWVAVGVLGVLALLLVPAALRFVRRRRRYLGARRGDADALWAELSDTAVDLGYVWSPARSPRQVATWLSRDAPAAATALRELASAVEHSRYAAAPGNRPGTALAGDLRTATGALRSRRSNGTRVRAALWPASLGWGRLPGRPTRRR